MVRETVRRQESNVKRGRSQFSVSSIPVAKAPSQPVLPPPRTSSPFDSEERQRHIADCLKRLGAPDISDEDLGRLCKGPLADALLFVVDHVKGRSETAASRIAVHQLRESGALRRHSDNQLSFTRAKNAASLLASAQTELKVAQDALNERLDVISEHQKEADRLQAALRERRLMSLLLQVLEKKEILREARVSEIRNMMEQLGRGVPKMEPIETPINTDVPRLSQKRVRAENTRDVLTAIRAQHIRLSGSPSTGLKGPQGQLQIASSEGRLRKIVASTVGLPEEHDTVVTAFDRCKRAAHHRVSERLRYHSPIPAHARIVSKDDLDGMLKNITMKEETLQNLSDRSLHLARSCAESVQSISAFVDVTTPALYDSLQEESQAAEGYIDTLRLSVMHRSGSVGEKLPEEDLMTDECKSWRQTLAEAQNNLEQVHERNSFLREAILSVPHQEGRATNLEELIGTYSASQAKAEERLSKLLTRKLEKARAGDVLVRDMERLVSEVGIIGALSGANG